MTMLRCPRLALVASLWTALYLVISTTTFVSSAFCPLPTTTLTTTKTESSSSSFRKRTTTTTTTTTTRIDMVQKIEKRLQELEITLPPAPKAAANYKPCQRNGDLLYLSGHIPIQNDGVSLITGKIGKDKDGKAGDGGGDMTVEQGYAAARQVGLNLLATIQKECKDGGGLDNVQQIVKLFGIVHSKDDFYEQHLIMNGCSDLFVQVFGKEVGCHARSAIGSNALPLGVSVEVEAIVRVKTNNNNNNMT